MQRVTPRGNPLFIAITVVLSSLVYESTSHAQAPVRSDYKAGPIRYNHFQLSTDIPQTQFIYYEDINKDGYTDLVLTGFTPINQARQGGRPGAILLNNGDNTFRAASGDRPNSEWVRELLVADFNGDGIPDLFMADHGWDAPPFPGFQNQLMLGTGSGFRNATNLLPVLDDFSHNAAAGDINKDGRVDILVANNAGGDASKVSYFLINKGEAGFELDRTRLPAALKKISEPSTWAVEIADMDGDGFADLLVGRIENPGTLPSRIYWNPGNGDFSNAQVTHLPDMTRFAPNGEYAVIEIKAFDLNNDGARDIQISAYNRNYRGLGMQFLHNQGPGTRQFLDRTDVCFGGPTQDPDPARDTPYFLRMHDVNRDGFPELVAVDNRDPTTAATVILENSGGGKWRAISRAQLSSNPEITTRLAKQIPLLMGANEFGFGETFVYNNNGVNTIGMNYIPLTYTHQPRVANRFDTCTNQILSAVAAGQFGNLELGFRLIQVAPTVRIQALESTVKQLSVLPAKSATLNASTGILHMPELYVDDTLQATGLRFQLVDQAQLIFELVGLD